jgi:hypothetical protein
MKTDDAYSFKTEVGMRKKTEIHTNSSAASLHLTEFTIAVYF